MLDVRKLPTMFDIAIKFGVQSALLTLAVPGFLSYRVKVLTAAYTAPISADAIGRTQQVDSVTIPDRAACPQCSVVFNRIATITPKETDSVLPLGVPPVVRTSAGQYFVGARDRIILYDAAGSFVHAFGRTGIGPGELRNVSRLELGAADSLLVFQTAGRFSVFSPEGSYVRDVVQPGFFGRTVPLTSEYLLFNGQVQTQTGAGYPMHILRADGTIAKSLSVGPPIWDPRCKTCSDRLVGVAGTTGSFWAAWMTQPRLERWSIAGQLEQVIVIDAAWFPKQTADVPESQQYKAVPAGTKLTADVVAALSRNITIPPGPLDISITDNGLILYRASGRREGERRLTTIDVIDPVRKELVTSASISGVSKLLPGGYAIGQRKTDLGLILMDVWKVELRRPSRQD
jgi:hypothetical protein